MQTAGEVMLGGGLMDEILLEESVAASGIFKKKIQAVFEESEPWRAYAEFAARRLKEKYFSEEDYYREHGLVQSVVIGLHAPVRLKLFMNFMDYSTIPLRVSNVLGGIFSVIGFIMTIVLIVRKILDPTIQTGWSSLMCLMLIIAGFLFLMIGVIGEYLGKLIDRYGNADAGNGVIFGDRDEVWYMEIYAGHQWAAVKIPDDCYVIAPNDGRIGKIDVSDKENVIVSAHLVDLAKKGGFFVGSGNVIDTTRTYCTELRNYSQIRAWETQRRFSPSVTSKTYDVNTYYPFAMKPDKNISLEDVMELCRWRYEGTEYDVNEHPEVRAIGINRTRQTSIFWLRPDKPEIMWNCFANPEMSIFLPMYKNTKVFPDAYSLVPTTTYDEQTAYYRFLRTGILAADDREGFGKKVRKSWKDMQRDLIDKTGDRDRDYMANSCSDGAAARIFDSVGTKALEQADQLYFEGMTDWLDTRMQDGGSDSPDAAYENITN